jgi:threonine dehydratase
MFAGDMSGQPRQIFDPASRVITTDASGNPRAVSATPFPGNIVPAARFDPLIVHVLDLAHAEQLALRAGAPVTVSGNTIADGLAAPFTGRLNLEAIQQYVDEVVLVSDDEIRAGMRTLLDRAKALAEPAGAAGLAALLAGKIPVAGKTVVVVLSGGNVDVAKLPELLA